MSHNGSNRKNGNGKGKRKPEPLVFCMNENVGKRVEATVQDVRVVVAKPLRTQPLIYTYRNADSAFGEFHNQMGLGRVTPEEYMTHANNFSEAKKASERVISATGKFADGVKHRAQQKIVGKTDMKDVGGKAEAPAKSQASAPEQAAPAPAAPTTPPVTEAPTSKVSETKGKTTKIAKAAAGARG